MGLKLTDMRHFATVEVHQAFYPAPPCPSLNALGQQNYQAALLSSQFENMLTASWTMGKADLSSAAGDTM